MRELPILFSGQMVRAILEGRKTQTRRVVKPQPAAHAEYRGAGDAGIDHFFVEQFARCAHLRFIECPYGQPGDRLWVRETWSPPPPHRPGSAVIYMADFDDPTRGIWKPSIHMPRSACRLLLEITDVRVERLQDIAEADAIAEGIPEEHGDRPIRCLYGKPIDVALDELPSFTLSARECFEGLWGSINGADSWAANPWVWVITFKRVTP